jgi:hypothetical protein
MMSCGLVDRYLYLEETSWGTRCYPGWQIAKPDSIFSYITKKTEKFVEVCHCKICAMLPTKGSNTYAKHRYTHTWKKKKTASWMNTVSCCTVKMKTKTCNEMRMLSCVRNVTEVLSDRKCSWFSFLEGNRTTQLPEYVNISGLGHTHTWLSASARLPTTSLLYTIPAMQLLTTPTHTSPLLSSANTSPSLHGTAHNHRYYAVVEYSSAAILLVSTRLCARSPENGGKGQKAQKLWVHTYRTVYSRPSGRCVQSLVQIGSEMWICIRYTQTNIQLYI